MRDKCPLSFPPTGIVMSILLINSKPLLTIHKIIAAHCQHANIMREHLAFFHRLRRSATAQYFLHPTQTTIVGILGYSRLTNLIWNLIVHELDLCSTFIHLILSCSDLSPSRFDPDLIWSDPIRSDLNMSTAKAPAHKFYSLSSEGFQRESICPND